MAKTINLYGQLEEPKHRKGYYLTLEPAFDIIPDRNDVDPETGYNINNKTPLVGNYDVCLYHSGKLCLSPFDYYQENEKDLISRNKKNRFIAESKFKQIIFNPLKAYTRFYDKQIIALAEDDFIYNQEPSLEDNYLQYKNNTNIGDFSQIMISYLLSEGLDNAKKMFSSFWARDYEPWVKKGITANKYTNENFHIFVLDKKENFGQLNLTPNIKNSLINKAEIIISNPSYELKMRLNNFKYFKNKIAEYC